MATINATIAINSGDLTSSPISINNTMEMMKAGTCHGLEQTSGLVRRTFTSTKQLMKCWSLYPRRMERASVLSWTLGHFKSMTIISTNHSRRY